MTEKTYLSAQELLEDSFRLGARIIQSGFKPSIITAIWRGGTPIGIAVQELLAYCGVKTDHIAIRTSSYSGIDGRASEIRIHGMNYLIKNVRHEDRLLIVDDVFDTGHTISAVINHLKVKARLNTPQDIRVAVPYYKQSRNQTDTVPAFYTRSSGFVVDYRVDNAKQAAAAMKAKWDMQLDGGMVIARASSLRLASTTMSSACFSIASCGRNRAGPSSSMMSMSEMPI